MFILVNFGRWVHEFYSAAAAKSLQSCPTLCDPIGGSPPGSATPGILQARTLEWVAISFSNKKSIKLDVEPPILHYLFKTLASNIVILVHFKVLELGLQHMNLLRLLSHFSRV